MVSNVNRLAAEGGVVVSHAPRRNHWLARMAYDVVVLTPPAIAVVITLLLAWQMRGVPLTLFDGILSPPGRPELYPSHWLSIGHAIVPVVFLIANLVNRRYGEDMALAHIFGSWSLVSLFALAMLWRVHPALPPVGAVPDLRVAAAFLGAMSIGQLAGVYVFDRTRGVEWWNAPVYSALTHAFVAMIIFYVAAYAGTDWTWINRMIVDIGVKATMAFALLVPYVLLRPIVRPTAGLGGY